MLLSRLLAAGKEQPQLSDPATSLLRATRPTADISKLFCHHTQLMRCLVHPAIIIIRFQHLDAIHFLKQFWGF